MINSSEPNCQKIAKTNSLQKNNHYVLIITKIWYLKKKTKKIGNLQKFLSTYYFMQISGFPLIPMEKHETGNDSC